MPGRKRGGSSGRSRGGKRSGRQGEGVTEFFSEIGNKANPFDDDKKNRGGRGRRK